MTVNFMVSSDGGHHVASSDDGLSITSWLLVMTVNYLIMVSSDDGQLPHGF